MGRKRTLCNLRQTETHNSTCCLDLDVMSVQQRPRHFVAELNTHVSGLEDEEAEKRHKENGALAGPATPQHQEGDPADKQDV